jgi:cell division transport system ATP-binding protein
MPDHDLHHPMIQLLGVSKGYPGTGVALNNLNLIIEHGEMVFVTGHSGAGKSTLLRLIGLLERPSQGRIYVDGVDLAQVKRGRILRHRRQVGLVFQDHKLLEDRSVYDNVALPLLIAGQSRRAINSQVHAALEQVGLRYKEKDYPASLSGGERQRISIARAIVHNPPLLLADEPTGSLDPALAEEIMALFVALNQLGTTIVVATHNFMLVRDLGKRILFLQHGRLVNQHEPIVAHSLLDHS